MKIIYLCPDLGIDPVAPERAAAHLRAFLRALRTLRHDVLVLSPYGGQSLPLGGPVRVPSAAVPQPDIIADMSGALEPELHRALAHIWSNVGVDDILRRAIRSERPDLVYERHLPFAPAGAVTCRRMGVRHILEVNAPLVWEEGRYRLPSLSPVARSLERAAFDATDAIVTGSSEARDLLIEAGIDPAKIEVVLSGVDPEQFAPDGPARPGGLAGKLVVGFVGSLEPWHGIEQLVTAFRAAASDPRFHLLVVGDGPERPRLEALAGAMPGRVTRTGPVPHSEVAGYLRAMDIAIAPAPKLGRYPCSPLRLLEYMATGRAIVASESGPARRLLRHEETGLLVPPGDVAALARSLADLAADPLRRARLGESAVAEVRGRHLWTHRAARALGMGTVAA